MWKWNDLKRLLTRKAATLDTRNLGAIMWPAVYPNMGDPAYQPRDPHCTIIYFGDVSGDIGFTKEDVIDAIKETQHDVFVWAKVSEVEWFGPEANIPVLRLEHDFLPYYWKQIKTVLRSKGIPFDETYPEYKPHLTIPDAAALDGVYPSTILLGPVELWWANDEKVKIAPGDGPVRVAV